MFEKAYEECRLCPRECGVNRKEGQTGFCQMDGTLRVARAALHMWEEPCISGKRGSGAVFFSGCNLRCVYCQNFDIAAGTRGKEISRERLSEIFLELQAQGAANIIAPLFGGIPATGAIARTMTNINNGGKTPIAGIIHAVVLLLILLFLMPLAQYIPMACLAGVLVIVSYNMSGWRVFRALLKNPKSDVTVLLITFFLTVIFDLTVAIEVGLVIACVLFMKRVMETTEISVITDEIDPNKESDIAVHEENLMIPKGIEVYEINGPYFFGIATKFEETMTQLGDRPKVRIIRMRKVPFIDSTGIHNLTTLCEMSQKEKTTVILSGVNENVHNVLEKAGFYELLGKENICPNINVALERAKSLVK